LRQQIFTDGGLALKKIILLIVAALTLFVAVPAFAAPAENANPRAFQV